MATVRRPAAAPAPPPRTGMQRPVPGPQPLGTPAGNPPGTYPAKHSPGMVDEGGYRAVPKDKWPTGAIDPSDPVLGPGGFHGYSAGGSLFHRPNLGGAAAPYYMQDPGAEADVKRLDELGTPAGKAKQAAADKAAYEARGSPKSGHAQYDPRIFEQWKQQHPNDPRAYSGPAGLPDAEAQKWYAKKGHEQWQQAVVKQQMLPNQGGSGPMPQGGLSRTTPGIAAGDDPSWAQKGKQWYDQQAAKFGAAPGATARTPIGTPGPGTPAGTPPTGKRPLPFSQDQLKPRLDKLKPGETVKLGDGKTYFKNQNGAVVDVTDPKARKRITDRQGAFIGQAAAPPPPGTTPPGTTPPPTTTPPGTTPPPTTTPPGTTPPGTQPPPTMPINPGQGQYPPVTQQPQQQYDPYSLNQFGYPQNQGPGPYGWNPGYGGSPFNYSNFSNSLMQGMGGYANGMMDYGGMPQQMQGMIDTYSGMGGYSDPYGMGGGGYGWPEAQMGMGMSNEMMGYGGGYGDPYGGMMGGGMDQLMGYNSGMGGYGDPYSMGGMGYY